MRKEAERKRFEEEDLKKKKEIEVRPSFPLWKVFIDDLPTTGLEEAEAGAGSDACARGGEETH